MGSIFQQISHSARADHWRRFRAVSAQFTRLLQVLRMAGFSPRQRIDDLTVGATRIEITDESGVYFIAEPVSLAPSPFYLKPETYGIAFSADGEAINECCAWLGDTVETRKSVENPQESLLWQLLISEERAGWTDLECMVLRAVQTFGQPDQEGEPLFIILGRLMQDLLSPDQFELSLESPADFWPGKPSGWTWVERKKGKAFTTTLTPRLQRLVYRRERILFVEDLASAYDIQIVSEEAESPFQSCVLFPLVGGAKPLGMIKLFYESALSPLPGDVEALELLRRELSASIDRGRARLLMQRMATVDGLTNLFNHRFFLEQIRTEFQRARRYQKMMAVIMIDIDDFKRYNDTYGHLAGDRVLAETSRTIRAVVRDIDFVARYGGEEFALILPEVDAQSGMIVAEKIRKAVEALRFISDDGETIGSITISCGVTDNTSVEAAEELIARADRALYWVKRHGRNLVHLAAGDDEE